VAAVDLLAPEVGEICGGSLREERLELLQQALDRTGFTESLSWLDFIFCCGSSVCCTTVVVVFVVVVVVVGSRSCSIALLLLTTWTKKNKN